MRPPSAAVVADVFFRGVDVVLPVLPDRAGLATHSRLSGTGLAAVDDHRPIEPRRQVHARLSGWGVADKPLDSAPEHLERPIRLRPPIHASTVPSARANTRLPWARARVSIVLHGRPGRAPPHPVSPEGNSDGRTATDSPPQDLAEPGNQYVLT